MSAHFGLLRYFKWVTPEIPEKDKCGVIPRWRTMDDPELEPTGKVLQHTVDHAGRGFYVYRDYDPEDGKWT